MPDCPYVRLPVCIKMHFNDLLLQKILGEGRSPPKSHPQAAPSGVEQVLHNLASNSRAPQPCFRVAPLLRNVYIIFFIADRSKKRTLAVRQLPTTDNQYNLTLSLLTGISADYPQRL